MSVLVVIDRVYSCQVKSIYLKGRKPFALFRLNVWNQHEISNILEKNEPHRSSISEVIESERSVYLNASERLFLKTLWQ